MRFHYHIKHLLVDATTYCILLAAYRATVDEFELVTPLLLAGMILIQRMLGIPFLFVFGTGLATILIPISLWHTTGFESRNVDPASFVFIVLGSVFLGTAVGFCMAGFVFIVTVCVESVFQCRRTSYSILSAADEDEPC